MHAVQDPCQMTVPEPYIDIPLHLWYTSTSEKILWKVR